MTFVWSRSPDNFGKVGFTYLGGSFLQQENIRIYLFDEGRHCFGRQQLIALVPKTTRIISSDYNGCFARGRICLGATKREHSPRNT